MRSIHPTQIISKRYSVNDDKVIEVEHGEYFSKQVADYIASHINEITQNDIIELKRVDNEKFNHYVIKYCRNQYNELVSKKDYIIDLLNKPLKRFEIFSLDVYGGKKVLLLTSNLPNGKEKDLYYNFDNANKVYQNLIDIKDIMFNEYDEVQEIYINDILKIENEIKKLKEHDEELYIDDVKKHDIVCKTSLYENCLELRKSLHEQNKQIMDMSKKLQISLERIEYLQTPKSFWEKLKELFGMTNKRKALPSRK